MISDNKVAISPVKKEINLEEQNPWSQRVLITGNKPGETEGSGNDKEAH